MWQKNVRYLDYNASSGISLPVKEALIRILNSDLDFANPTSRHRLGQKSRHALLDAENKIHLALLPWEEVSSQSEHELIFTSSGTEANQTVIRSMAEEEEALIIGVGEHSASYDLIKELKNSNVFKLPLTAAGNYDFVKLKTQLDELSLLGKRKIGMSLFWANNETGVMTHLKELKSLVESFPLSIKLHLDGAQVWGKIAFSKDDLWADYYTFSSHKIGAPAGTGIILKKKSAELKALISGTQAHGFRGGTENSLNILATAAAAEALNADRFTEHTEKLRDHLERGLNQLGFPIRIWGNEVKRVPNTSRFSFAGFKSYESWVELLDLKGFAVSHGSACKAQIIEPSRVLLEMGATREEALNSLRVSLGEDNTLADVDGFLIALAEILESKKERQTNPLAGETK